MEVRRLKKLVLQKMSPHLHAISPSAGLDHEKKKTSLGPGFLGQHLSSGSQSLS